MVTAVKTAAAGAQGAEMRRCVPPNAAATNPRMVTPSIPAKAP